MVHLDLVDSRRLLLPQLNALSFLDIVDLIRQNPCVPSWLKAEHRAQSRSIKRRNHGNLKHQEVFESWCLIVSIMFHHFPSFSIISHVWLFPSLAIIFHHVPSFSIISHHFPSFPFLFHQSHLLLPGCLAQSDNYLTRLYLTSDFKASIPKTERITLRSTMTPQTEHMQILVASSCYCFASVGMLLFNKFAVQDFPLEPGGVNG